MIGISPKKYLGSETYRLYSLPQIRVAAPSQRASWDLRLFTYSIVAQVTLMSAISLRAIWKSMKSVSPLL